MKSSEILEVNNSYEDRGQDNNNNNNKINYTIYSFPKDKWIIIPNWQLAIKITTFIPLIIFGIICNYILINIIYRNRSLRTPINLLIANISIVDLLTLCICTILFMFHDFYQNYQLGMFGCKLEGFIESTLLLTAILNLCAISYDRLTAITLPYEAKLTINGSKIIIIFTWLIGFILSIPVAVYRTYEEIIWSDFVESYCKDNTSVLRMYWHVLIVSLVWFSSVVMILCYSVIFCKLDSYEKINLKRENPLSISYKRKIIKMLFIIIIVFVILRTPFNVLIFIMDHSLKNSDINQLNNNSFNILWYTSHYLIYLNAAINPIIYGLYNDNFRRAYNQTPIFLFNLLQYKWKYNRNKIQKSNTNNFLRIFRDKNKLNETSKDDYNNATDKYFVNDRIFITEEKHQSEQNQQLKIFIINNKLQNSINSQQFTSEIIENQQDTTSTKF